MKKWAIIFFSLSLLLILLDSFVSPYNSAKLFFKTLIDDDFYIVYEDSELGKVYHFNTFYMPDDSLVEYFWRGNSAIIGHNKLSDSNKIEFLSDIYNDEYYDEILTYFVRIYKADTTLEDTLIVISSTETSSNQMETIVFLDSDDRIIHLNGIDYSIENAVRLAHVLYYGDTRKLLDLQLIKTDDLLNSEKTNKLSSS